jgi:hypothetical protein
MPSISSAFNTLPCRSMRPAASEGESPSTVIPRLARGERREGQYSAHFRKPIRDRLCDLLRLPKDSSAPHTAPSLRNRLQILTSVRVVWSGDVVGDLALRHWLDGHHSPQLAGVLEFAVEPVLGCRRGKEESANERKTGRERAKSERTAFREVILRRGCRRRFVELCIVLGVCTMFRIGQQSSQRRARERPRQTHSSWQSTSGRRRRSPRSSICPPNASRQFTGPSDVPRLHLNPSSSTDDEVAPPSNTPAECLQSF